MSTCSAATATPISTCRPHFLRTMCDACKELQKACIADGASTYIPTRSLQYPEKTYPMIFDMTTETDFDVQTIGVALGAQERRFHVWIRECNEREIPGAETDIWIRHSRDLSYETGNGDKVGEAAGFKISILVDFPSDHSPTINVLPLLPEKIVDSRTCATVVFQDRGRWTARPALGPGQAQGNADKNEGGPVERQRYDSSYYRLQYFAEFAKSSGPCMIWSNLPLFEGGDVGVARGWSCRDNFVYRA
ncbi:hypothetical protein BDV06DRAFT_228878 [Aspergillus oleicola]